MNSPKTLLFDLDGTLTDSKPGILGSLRKALQIEKITYNEPLEKFIGPPVEQWAQEILPDGDDKARLQLATTYRALYSQEGWAQNAVYAGIPELLQQLKLHGVCLYVCTSKHEPFAERIVAKFELAQYFDRVYGDLPDCDHEKSALVARLLKTERLDPGSTSMVGDRRYDVRAAHANGLRVLGALWGYGSAEELTEAGAEVLCATPNDVLETVLSLQQA